MRQTSLAPNAIEKFGALVRCEPDIGIGQLAATFRFMENQYFKGDDFIKNLAGGAPEGITWGLYNAIGSVYPTLNRRQKDNAISQTLAIMDATAYTAVNGFEGVGHTTGIREPLYLGEIASVRRMYWPGLDEGKLIIMRHCGNFKEIKADIMDKDGAFRRDKVHSDFVVAYAFLRKDFSDFGEKFAESFDRDFITRTIVAITKMRISNAKTEKGVSDGLERLRYLLPKSLHRLIDWASGTRDWVDPTQFT